MRTKKTNGLPRHPRLKTAGRVIFTIISALIGTLGVLLFTGAKWMFRTWPHMTIDELTYTLQSSMGGADPELVAGGFNSVGTYLLLTVLFILIVVAACVKAHRKGLLLLFDLAILTAGLLLGRNGVMKFVNKLEIGTYIENLSSSSNFIDQEYVDPNTVKITAPEQKRNLIVIYMESMEATYSDKEDGGAFDEDYIPELTKLAQENQNFAGDDRQHINGADVLPYSTWTMGGLYTQSTTLPLRLPFNGLAMDTQSTFFPQVTAIGDILKTDGYRQSYQCGSDANFAGRRLFFETHGQYDIYDLYYAREAGEVPEDYKVFWGYEDEKLFAFAKEHLTEIAASGQPFNYTMLTVDTHFEDGFRCPNCGYEFGDNQYANVIHCSSRSVAAFVDWVKQQDFYENTTIVLVGDHLTMDSDFCESVSEDYNRKTFVTFVNPAVQPADPSRRREFSTNDIMPTTLAALGYQIEGDRLGLGTNLFGTTDTLVEQYGVKEVAAEMEKRSLLLENLADSLEVEAGRAPEEEVNIMDPYTEITVVGSNEETGILTVTAKNTVSSAGVNGMRLAVWTAEERRDVQIVTGIMDGNGTYYFSFNQKAFRNPYGLHGMQFYVVADDGTDVGGSDQFFYINEEGEATGAQ